jgi:transcriptional regulator with XRE-family HTH domain
VTVGPDAQREFGRRVRHFRCADGLTLRALARRCGVHWTYLGQIERGQRNPSLVVILTIAKALQVDAGELLRGLNGRGQAALFE